MYAIHRVNAVKAAGAYVQHAGLTVFHPPHQLMMLLSASCHLYLTLQQLAPSERCRSSALEIAMMYRIPGTYSHILNSGIPFSQYTPG